MPRFGGLAALLTKTAEETAKRKDIADEAVNKTGVPFLLGDVETNAGVARTEAQAAQGTANTANTNANSRIYDANNAVKNYHLENDVVVARNIAASLENPPTDEYGLRLLTGNGTSRSGSSSDHVHSIPYKNLPLGAQEGILQLRESVREAPVSGQVSRAEHENIKALVMTLCVLLFDDEEHTAEETHSLLKSDPEFKEDYEEQFLHDYGDGLEPRRRGRFGRQEHPDIGRFVRKPDGT